MVSAIAFARDAGIYLTAIEFVTWYKTFRRANCTLIFCHFILLEVMFILQEVMFILQEMTFTLQMFLLMQILNWQKKELTKEVHIRGSPFISARVVHFKPFFNFKFICLNYKN